MRRAVPDVALRTTCIVGFPGETEEDFARLLDLLEETAFERVGFFTYSAQAGTRAVDLADDVPEAVKFERLERATEHQRLITGERYEGRVGTIAQAIIDRAEAPASEGPQGPQGPQGRLSWQADDIDGITYLDRRDLDRRDLAPGTIVEVQVDEVVDDYDFRATVRRVVVPAPTTAVRGPGAAPPPACRRRRVSGGWSASRAPQASFGR